jgi:pimeloyl-ACP methyl ester carboxylesterase
MTDSLSIIAIHGNGGGGFRFERLRPYLPPTVRFEAPTLPGFGGEPADASLRTLADYAGWLRDRFFPPHARPILLGHGIGGSIVLEYLQHFPETVGGVILHAPVGANLDTRFFPKLMGFEVTRSFGKWLFSSEIARPVFRRMLFSESVPDDYLDKFFGEYRQCAAFSQMFDLITADWFAGLKPVDLPATLLWGARERVLKVEQAAAFREKLPRAETVIVEHWDHFPMIEQPEAYAGKIVELARSLTSPTPVNLA